MRRYQVCQSQSGGAEIVLSDDLGRRHLARPINDVPAVGTPLKGPRPALGFGVLMCAATNRAFRIIFVQIDCDGAAARDAAARAIGEGVAGVAWPRLDG